jgi:hypothetical protein
MGLASPASTSRPMSLRGDAPRQFFASFVRGIPDYDVEIRRIICSTNAIESLNARYRRAVRHRGHFLLSRPHSYAAIW